jgi:hypothetical protein
MAEVSSMFTMGMNPCIGLVLWSKEMCAVGHFHDWEKTPIAQCGVVVKQFCRVSSPNSRRAVIVMATVTEPDKAWHSEAMKVDLDKVVPLAYEVVKPAAVANVKISLKDGKLDYNFAYENGTKLARTPIDNWTARPTGADFLVIGVFGSPDKIQYVKGNQPEQLNQVLTIALA